MTTSIMDDVDLTEFKASFPATQLAELIAQKERARGLWERLQRDDTPGVILGDEVGKGKTYVALALAFATLAERQTARVLILTHSRRMAGTWAQRWSGQISSMVASRWRDRFQADWAPRVINSYRGFVAELEATQHKSAILFASYDTLKLYHSPEDRRRILLGALRCAFKAHRIRLSKAERSRLVRDLMSAGGTMPRKPAIVDEREAIQFLKDAFDPATRAWKGATGSAVEDFLGSHASLDLPLKPKLDLLIVDEAHKLEGNKRSRVVTQLLSRKFRRAVWVTATPFALSIEELRRRLAQFRHAAAARADYVSLVEALPLDEYKRAVSERVAFERKDELQTSLRRRLVRSSWGLQDGRSIVDCTGEACGASLLPSMVLERVVDNLMASGKRTHIASVRETLCSSWAATLSALEKGTLTGIARDPWASHLRNLLNGSTNLDPKMAAVVDYLAKQVEKNEKTVVFTNRLETSAALVVKLNAHKAIRTVDMAFHRKARNWRGKVEFLQRTLGIPTSKLAWTLAKVMAYSTDSPGRLDVRSVKRWWQTHHTRLEQQANAGAFENVFEFLDHVAGRRRHLPIVVRYDGDVSGGDDTDPESITNDWKFNLPSAPLILIASRKGQEGIDLHHYCRRVVLYDLPWNPALIEQRIGRVHRLGGMRSKKRPLEVVYCYRKNSYEELIANRVKQRCEMMHALLGAGTWLHQEREVDGLSRYAMTFPP